MPAPAKRIWEYGDYWIGRVAGSEYLYACWWDKRKRRTGRRSLETKVLAEAQERLIELAGSVRTDGSRSSDSVLLMGVLDFYFENDAKFKASKDQAFRAIQLVAEFAGQKIGATARVSAFSLLRQREFMRWCVDTHDHRSGTIARNLAVVSAAFRYACKPQLVRDGFGNDTEVVLLESAPAVCTQAKEVARLTDIPESEPRGWVPTFEELGRFIDAIDLRQENLFRFVMLALNTWARPEAIIDFRPDKQVDRYGVLDLNPPGRRQTKKYRPKIRLTENLKGWLEYWNSTAPMIWDGEPITTMKRTFKRHGEACGMPLFTQYTLRHFMATEARQLKPPVSREQRDLWLGHDDGGRTANWYEHRDPEFLEDARRATDTIIDLVQQFTRRPLSTRKLRANASLRLIKGKGR